MQDGPSSKKVAAVHRMTENFSAKYTEPVVQGVLLPEIALIPIDRLLCTVHAVVVFRCTAPSVPLCKDDGNAQNVPRCLLYDAPRTSGCIPARILSPSRSVLIKSGTCPHRIHPTRTFSQSCPRSLGPLVSRASPRRCIKNKKNVKTLRRALRHGNFRKAWSPTMRTHTGRNGAIRTRCRKNFETENTCPCASAGCT